MTTISTGHGKSEHSVAATIGGRAAHLAQDAPRAASETLRTFAPDPTLAADAAPLARNFPNELEGTRLTLYDGGPGEMRVHWRLERNDLERVGANFSAEPGGTRLVVRLRRLRDQGGGGLAGETAIDRAKANNSGEAGFRLDPYNALYHAELGHTNGGGGWLMLARSNRLYNLVGIGPSFPGEPREPEPRADAAESALSSLPAGADLSASFPLVQHRGTTPDRPAAAVVSDGPVPDAAPDEESFGAPPAANEPAADGAFRAAEYLVQPDEHPSVADSSVGSGTPLQGDARALQWGRISPLTYEDAVSRAACLEIDAELRVHGRAPPNSDIDLFGHPFRVGPGGRFLLVLPVADPDLLKQMLDLRPPPELGLHRDD